MEEYDFKQSMVNCEPQAIETLKRTMRESGPNALKAAELVLSYTQGKPEQKVSGDVGLNIRIRHFMEDPITGEVIEHISTKGPESSALTYKPKPQANITTQNITTQANITTQNITDARYTEQPIIGRMEEF